MLSIKFTLMPKEYYKMKKTILVTLLVVIWLMGCNSSPNARNSQPTSSSPPLPTLPQAVKGYELYSWQQADQWHFTLMSGTNLVKSDEEIMFGKNTITADGWIRLSVSGVEAAQQLLARLPPSAEVVWIGQPQSRSVEGQAGQITLPSQEIVDVITQECQRLGLKLYIN